MQLAKFDISSDQGKECWTAKAIMNRIRSPPLISRQAAQILLDYLSNISIKYAGSFGLNIVDLNTAKSKETTDNNGTKTWR